MHGVERVELSINFKLKCWNYINLYFVTLLTLQIKKHTKSVLSEV
jgi:hypothetical protein